MNEEPTQAAPREISQRVTALHLEIDMLNGVAKQLINRLSPVLRNEGTPELKPDNYSPATTALGQDIVNAEARIWLLRRDLSEVIRQLEL